MRIILFSLVLLLVLSPSQIPLVHVTPLQYSPLDLKQINDLVRAEVSGQQALDNVAYVYMGWRTAGGPWYNAVLDWIAGDLKEMGFSQGIQFDGDKYWMQQDLPGGSIWDPKYASLEIVGSEGDDNFDFKLNTFDPTSIYYPQDITYDWIIKNIGSTKEAGMNQRARLATNSGFTDKIDTKPEKAKGITGELVYVGEVYRDSSTGRYYWTENAGANLKGKFILATNSRSRAYRLALQEGAIASLCSQIEGYNNPIVDGKELNPTVAKYAGVTNSESKNPVAFNLSPQDERYLISLSATGPISMRAVAIGNFYPYSQQRPLKTLIAEIKGSSKPDERLVFAAHVQEPGAADNGSGVGLQLEIVRVLMKLIQEGKLPRPERTMTFLWGLEMSQVSLWAAAHPDQMLNVKAGLILDMVGEDPAKCGGIMRIEKTPDPSAVYTYGLDLLPGEEPPPMTDAYVRQPDKHTLWGAGELEFWPYPGFYLNDLYFQSASLVSQDFPGWQVGWNPWEGGSDHDPFLWYQTSPDNYYPIPAVLTWHFTDYFYHSNLDTMDKVSADELRNVGITTINVGYFQAIAEEEQAIGIMEIVRRHAWQRFDWEEENSKGALTWAYEKAVKEGKSETEIKAAIDDALKLELEILKAWATWYKEAITSARNLLGTDVSIRYQQLEQRNLREMDDQLAYAVMEATQFADSLKLKV
jgi:hypothetical protein